MILVGDETAGGQIHQLDYLDKITSVLAVNILDGRRTVGAGIGIINGRNAILGVSAEENGAVNHAIAALVIDTVWIDDDGVTGALNDAG